MNARDACQSADERVSPQNPPCTRDLFPVSRGVWRIAAVQFSANIHACAFTNSAGYKAFSVIRARMCTICSLEHINILTCIHTHKHALWHKKQSAFFIRAIFLNDSTFPSVAPSYSFFLTKCKWANNCSGKYCTCTVTIKLEHIPKL